MADSSLRQRCLGSTFLSTGFIQLVFSQEELKPELKVVFGQDVLNGLIF
jgi:hypothetical protein